MAKLEREPKDPVRLQRAELVRAATGEAWRSRPGGKLEWPGRDGLKLVTVKEPGYILDGDGEIVGVDAWVQLFDERGRELPIDPHRRIINPPIVPRAGVRRMPGRSLRDPLVLETTPDPLAAFQEAVWDSVEAAPNPKGWRTRGTVTTIFSAATDGVVVCSSVTSYADARNGTGTLLAVSSSGSDFVGQQEAAASTQWDIREMFISFDLTAIPSTQVKDSAVLDMWLVTDRSTTADFVIEARHSVWTPALTTADFVAGASLSGLTRLASLNTSGIGGTGSYKTFTSDASMMNPTFINAATLPLMLSSSRTQQNLSVATNGDENIEFSLADFAGTTQDPRLTVTHHGLGRPMFQHHPARIWRLG